ncbi:MAG: DUF2721 domain-containing protein [Acetobacteraceae bacterium]|nr:DUF2721 domain-containing protein [Acetobacteraceae bacterium]
MGRAIAGALTPAFLLAGTAGMLNVMSQRRNRIVDRLLATHDAGDPHDHLGALYARARLALWAMMGCILASILVALLVALSFVAKLHGWAAGPLVTVLMLGAMAALAAGLLCFLAEATLARGDVPPPR